MLRMLLYLLIGSVLVSSARAESADERFLAGLSERHLYRLADVYGTKRWARDDLSDRDRAELAIGLALVYTDQALASPPGERAAAWKKAQDVCEALLADWPNNPRRRLVEVQRALVSLARGRQIREESVGTANASTGHAEALEHLRTASRQLADIAEAVNQELTDRRMRPTGDVSPAALSTSELQSLEANVRYQLARAQHQLGLCYGPRTADRDDALLQALSRLEPLVQQTELDDLAWLARLEAAACQRELGRLQEALERLNAWAADEAPPGVAARLAAERVRLLLAAGKVDDAGRVADEALRSAKAASGDLALAQLEVSLARWREASHRTGSTHQPADADALTAEVAAIGRQHGPYWARRAESLVGRALATSQPTGNADALLLAAKNLYLNGRPDEALAAYDQAAAHFATSQRPNEAFAAAMTAAAIVRQENRWADAAERYRRLSLDEPRHPRAAEAHRLAILSMADLLRERDGEERQPIAASYEALLDEHLKRWPDGPVADQVRWWLGRLLASRHDWKAARGVLQQIPPSSEHFQNAVYLVVECYEAELKRSDGPENDATDRQAELLATVTKYLEPVVARMHNQPPGEWTELECWAAVTLADLQLRYATGRPTDAVRLLGPVVRALFAGSESQAEGPDPAWQQQALSLYIVTLAHIGKHEDAGNLLQWQAANFPAALPGTLDRLGEQLTADGSVAERETAELVLEGLQLVDPQQITVDEPTRRRLVRRRASALAVAGRRDEALREYADLAERLPDDGNIQESYAVLLAQSESPAELREALTRWHEVEQRSRSGSPRWRRARRARIELLVRLGRRDEAEKLLRLTRLLYPDWNDHTAE